MASETVERLQTGKWKGLEFDFISLDDDHSFELDILRFPNRHGAAVRQRASNELRIDVAALFFEDAWPTKLDDFLRVTYEGAIGELVHPVFGRLTAAVERMRIRHDAEDAIDAAAVQISFVEHRDEAVGPFEQQTTAAAHGAAARSWADKIVAFAGTFKTVLATLEDPSLALQEVPTDALDAALAIRSCADALDQSSITVLDVQTQVNGASAKCDAIVQVIANYETPEARDLGYALIGGADALAAMGTSIIEAKPPLQILEVVADTNILALAHGLYGDSSRADELMTLNTFDDPMAIPRGFRLRHYAA